jgi:hypothetical protein
MQSLPDSFPATRAALHALAEQTIAPEREAATGRIGLRATPGGFGTPVFGDRRRLRVEGAELVLEDAGGEERRPLDVDPAAARVLADFYGFVTATLEELARGNHELRPSVIQLWPEHFDIAMELGTGTARANYGGSPGDGDHPQPYLYVGPWEAPPPGELWNATGFTGAELPYAELVAAADPYAHALGFYRARLAALTG